MHKAAQAAHAVRGEIEYCSTRAGRPLTVLLMSVRSVFAWQDPAAQTPPPQPSSNEPQVAEADRAATPASSQFGEPERKRWFNMALPLMVTSSLPPSPRNELALSPREKVADTIKHTIGPSAPLDRAFLAGMNQLRTKPEEWGQGWDAYGRRFGYRMTRSAVRNAVLLSADIAMGTDPRYDRCDSLGLQGARAHCRRLHRARGGVSDVPGPPAGSRSDDEQRRLLPGHARRH